MEIPSDIRPPDPSRRRANEAPKAREPGDDSRPAGEIADGDSVRLSGPAPEEVARWVEAVKTLAPERLHRVEELREKIADGSYRADPDEMAGPLLDLIGGG